MNFTKDSVENVVDQDPPFDPSKPIITSACIHQRGHTKAQCYKQNGYPPNYKKNKPSSNSANQVSSRSVNQVSLSSMSQDSPSQFQLTAQQYNQLMSLLQGQTSNVTVPHQNHGDSNGMIMSASSFNLLRDCWLVDSGASTHTITLPNHIVVPVVAVGTVQLSSTLLLHKISVEDSGSMLVTGFGLMPPRIDEVFSVTALIVLMELKIPVPLIPVLDPSSAAN
ncbi:hypothetical protein HKD37_17G048495 [Glycine soja]